MDLLPNLEFCRLFSLIFFKHPTPQTPTPNFNFGIFLTETGLVCSRTENSLEREREKKLHKCTTNIS